MLSVQQLIDTLQTINNPEARIVIIAAPQDRDADNGNGTAHGDVAHIGVARIDGNDVLVTLTNHLSDAQGNIIFDAPPQFKRFSVSTTAGLQEAAADFQEQANCEPTMDLATYLEVRQFERLFKLVDSNRTFDNEN